MNIDQAKKAGFTHHAKMYGIQGYANLEDENHDTFRAKYWLTDQIVEFIIYVEMFIPSDHGFKILLGPKL